MFFKLIIMLFSALVTLSIICIWIYILKRAIKQNKQRKKNDASPVSVAEATLVKKREVKTATGKGARYYATFEFENGDRREFLITWIESFRFEAGFFGRLSFQGTRYKKFEKIG